VDFVAGFRLAEAETFNWPMTNLSIGRHKRRKKQSTGLYRKRPWEHIAPNHTGVRSWIFAGSILCSSILCNIVRSFSLLNLKTIFSLLPYF
jgi:hypothetical protein